MRLLALISLMLGVSACAVASEASSEGYTDAQELIISEFEKFYELELIDCLVGWDTAIYQGEQGRIDFENIPAQKLVVELMSIAFERKTGGGVDMDKLRPKSSFHISGLYFTDQDDHAEYQEKVIGSCLKQMTRITNLANSKAPNNG